MNFYGLETEAKDLVCSWQHDPIWYLRKLKYDMFVNTIRLPFSHKYVVAGNWTTMDNIMAACESLDVRVILDYHRVYDTHQSPVPEDGITRKEFIRTWLEVIQRYPSAFGVGVFNEIQEEGIFNYTISLHHDVISSIESVIPDRYHYFLGCPGWGGNCTHMGDLPSILGPIWNRTYIEVHKYSFTSPLGVSDWETTIPRDIDSNHWFIGEIGWKDTETQWAETFIAYLKSRGIYNVCAWTIANSYDTDGWWHDDCETFIWEKAELITRLWAGDRKLRGPMEDIMNILRVRNETVIQYDAADIFPH